MATSTLTVALPEQRSLEDPLAHLPCSSILEYRRGQVIYDQDQPSTSIYLVIDGKVKVCRMADDGRQVVVDIYQADEFFGESAFLSASTRDEQALALDSTKVMTWTTNEIEEITMKRPKLAIALLQLLVQRSMDFGYRIESFSVDNIARRLARTLIRFEARISRPPPNAIAMLLSLFLKSRLKVGPGVVKVALVCATPPSTWANGVKRVLLRALNSGPARKL